MNINNKILTKPIFRIWNQHLLNHKNGFIFKLSLLAYKEIFTLLEFYYFYYLFFYLKGY